MEGEIESRAKAKEKFKASCPKKTSLCWPRRQPVLSGLVSGYTILCVIAMIGTVECEELSVVDSDIKTMFDLCEKGDLERLKPLVEVYRNPPYPNGNCDARDRCNTLLHLAAEKGHLRIVQLMVPLLEDKNPKGYENVTPLHKAVEKGHLEIVQFMVLLLDEKNPRGGWGVTPLHIAAEKGYLEIVQFMVPLLDDKNPRSARSRSSYPSGGVTPLHKAAKEGHLEIIQFLTPLLRWKNPEDNCNGTPLSYAAENNHLNVVMYLSGQVQQENSTYFYPLYVAAANGSLEVVQYLVPLMNDKNPKVSFDRVPFSFTPLDVAANNGHLEVVKYLFGLLQDKNLKDRYGSTPLHFAASNGHKEVVEYFCGQFEDKNPKNSNGVTPLHLAAENGHLEVVKYLSGQIEDLNPQENLAGNTPLHYATYGRHLDIVQFLIPLLNEKNPKNKRGETPFHHAAIGSFSSNLCSGFNTDTGGDVEVVKYLLGQLEDKNPKTNLNDTVLHFASIYGNLDVVKVLCEQAEDKNPKRDDGVTPLHLVALRVPKMGGHNYCHLDVFKYICGQVQDKNPAADGYGLMTPLHLVAYYRFTHFVKYLVSVIDVKHPKDANGDTPLDLAKQTRWGSSDEHAQSEIINILEKYDEDEEETRHLTQLLEEVQQLKSYFQKPQKSTNEMRSNEEAQAELVQSLQDIEKHFAQKVQEAEAKQKPKIDYYKRIMSSSEEVARYRQPSTGFIGPTAPFIPLLCPSVPSLYKANKHYYSYNYQTWVNSLKDSGK